MNLGVKSTFEGAVRRFTITLSQEDTPDANATAEFRELCACVSRVHSTKHFHLHYQDEDYDLIPITSDIELRHAAHYAERNEAGGVLRLNVETIEVTDTDPAEETTTPRVEMATKKSGGKKGGASKAGANKGAAKSGTKGGKRGKRPPPPVVDDEPGSETDTVSEVLTDTRFDVHEGFECMRCTMDPIIGVRHWCVSRPAVNMCDGCRGYAGAELDALAWRRIAYPWLADDATRIVPLPPLQLGDSSPQVKLLQKLLIELGYMSAEHVDKLVGWFQGHTAQAVATFRAEYGIEADSDAADYVYDEGVAAALADAVANADIE